MLLQIIRIQVSHYPPHCFDYLRQKLFGGGNKFNPIQPVIDTHRCQQDVLGFDGCGSVRDRLSALQNVRVLAMSKRFLKRLLLHTAQIKAKRDKFWWYAIAAFFKNASTLRVRDTCRNFPPLLSGMCTEE